MLQEEKVFKDPVHNYVHVQDRTIWDLINTSEFQRLRRIRQLGTSYFTFHGAEHSRFSHSLGVYEITRRIISQFERNGYVDWPEEEGLLTLCAALLHDVGHGPFSHSIEEAFGMFHEDWTCRIILEDTEIHRVLARIDPGFPEKVASVIRKSYASPIVVNLVSGPLDADRMDYLLRDAYFTGVNYGTFDLDRILRLLRPHKDRIVVKESGMHAVEHYLLSRYEMYWQVYFHPVTRSSEMLLRHIFKRAGELYREGFAFQFFLPPLTSLFEGTIGTSDYLKLDEALVQTTFMQWRLEKDERLADLCERFMERKLYKYIETDQLDKATERRLSQIWTEAGLDPEYDLMFDSPSDNPYDVYRVGDEPTQQHILLLDPYGRVMELSKKSDIVRSISGIRRGKHYIYFPKDKLEAVQYALPADVRQLFLPGEIG
ncbi:HD domain-containing protein [Paenibacillus thiaminolyticus]|uniref:HD domain-containing protein n=1 Tax=Paenibacillus thiaminolyticus TaxID=49283 RepID=A0AAP9J406_PANTH|nr:HD domain-containing protein [Paenibacillus thiaminolyticus]MCY9534782.1 HD domain-containing protein [Paenibacillus thiaminolyticus]MCY9605304.1 HD domain-containing protein [Paenibacillus thiaminolyticus]MCY9606537.1 HD domain-containing protein [Paenibacillus thiaminolyticus]MCY9611692.1 HD domain-containing protein [Paenibacillus thiaminolyticus]MCY9621792.1 HD domain-containing protein [Paenibacillus thiaminolyticus]